MKIKNYIFILGCALLMTSCHLDAPEIPSEELFLRNFIKRFGLIDPNQDWNLAEQSSITVNFPRGAQKVVIYAEIFDEFYRVARCYDVASGVSVFPIDVPVNTTSLAIEVDGVPYITDLGGKIDLATATPAKVADSRADDDPWNIFNGDEDNILGWVIVCEDLGSTDDIDFNDVVFRMEYDQTSYYALGQVQPDKWDVIDQQIGDLYFDDGTITSRAGESGSRAGKMVVSVKALAAGGILKSWLHYRSKNDSSKDYLIGPCVSAGDTDDVYPLTDHVGETAALDYEWHRWFGLPDGKMINTASSSASSGGDSSEDNTLLPTPYPGAKINVEVDQDFTFTTYSQATYSDGDPITSGNFTFEKHTIEGFYITVNSHMVNLKDPAHEGGNAQYSYDLGKVIGHSRQQGLPPQMFLIPDLYKTKGSSGSDYTGQDHFRWPTERTQIDDAYTQFDDWVKYGNTVWYQNGREDYVISNHFINEIYKTDYINTTSVSGN